MVRNIKTIALMACSYWYGKAKFIWDVYFLLSWLIVKLWNSNKSIKKLHIQAAVENFVLASQAKIPEKQQ